MTAFFPPKKLGCWQDSALTYFEPGQIGLVSEALQSTYMLGPAFSNKADGTTITVQM